MSTYDIRFDGANVKIHTKSVPVTMFYSTSQIGSKTQNVDEFTDEQHELRALDCMKDGMVGTRVHEKVVPNVYPKLVDLAFSKLGELESAFEENPTFKRNTKKYAWTKVSKDSELTPKIPISVMSQESGLHPQYYVNYQSLLMNFANEVLDPAGRESADSATKPVILLFDNNKTFNIDNSFFTLFGMPGVSLSATRRGAKGYAFEFVIWDENNQPIIKITDKQTAFTYGNNQKVKVPWFSGNNVKNKLINEGINASVKYTDAITGITCSGKDIIRALFMLKTAGDALQVLLLLVFCNMNPHNQNSAISTCDKVVFLLCMILGLKCFLTSADKSAGKKLRCIEYYDPVPRTLEHAKQDIDAEKSKINAHNTKIIGVFRYLSEHSSTQEVMVSGDNNPRVFNKRFYDKIVEELTKINADLDQAASKIKELRTPAEIDSKMNQFKEHFTINPFIRKQGSNIIFGLAKKFTKANHAEFRKKRPELNGFGSKSIFEHGVLDKTGGAMRAASRKPHSPHKVLKYVEFDDSEFEFVDDDSDDAGAKQIGLYAHLLQEIDRESKNVLSMSTVVGLDPDKINEIINITIKSELLYNFYLKNEVLYGSELRELIEEIIENDIDLGYFSHAKSASVRDYTYSPLVQSLRTTPPSPVSNREMPMELPIISYKTPGPLKLIDAESQPDDFENIGYESSTDSLRSNTTNLSDYGPSKRNILNPMMPGVRFTWRNNNPFASPPGAAKSPRRTIRSPPGAAFLSKRPRIDISSSVALEQRMPTPVNKNTRRRFFREDRGLFGEYGGFKRTAKRGTLRKKRNTRTRKQ